MLQTLGPVILDLQGLELDPEEREMLNHPLVGGVILFSRNYANRVQLHDLCQQVRLACEKPLLIAVDQEGGRVQRFRNEGFTRLPAMGVLGTLYQRNPQQALQLTYNCGWLLAAELLANNIDLSFAPVLDLNKELNTVIGDRAFHSDPHIITLLAQRLIAGMKAAGMAAVGKHFPGHGSVTLDSHEALPIDNRKWNLIEQEDLQPFKVLIKSGLEGMMSSHILFSEVDAQPVTFSQHWLKHILRQELHFKGVVFSDDLNMKGSKSAGDYVSRAKAALAAGCDFILICNNRPGAITILDQLDHSYSISVERVKSLRGQCSYSWEELTASSNWKKIHDEMRSLV